MGEIHLAGFESQGALLIDTHSRPVTGDVWSLYRAALERFGPRPTLIEWDTDIPALDVLLAEARNADAILRREARRGAGRMSALATTQREFIDALYSQSPCDPGVEVYRRNMLANLGGALAATFPVVERLVGEAFFREAARTFVLAHPSRAATSTNTARLSPISSAAIRTRARLAYLPDVARLEWACHEILPGGRRAGLRPRGARAPCPRRRIRGSASRCIPPCASCARPMRSTRSGGEPGRTRRHARSRMRVRTRWS